MSYGPILGNFTFNENLILCQGERIVFFYP